MAVRIARSGSIFIGTTAWVLLLFPYDLHASDHTLKERCKVALVRSDELWTAGKAEEAHAQLDPLIKEARAENESLLLLALLARKGQMWVRIGMAKPAEKILREARDLAEHLEKDTSLRDAIRWLGVAVETQGRMDEALSLYQRLLDLSRRAGDGDHEAWALVGIAWNAMHGGDASSARRDYEQAVAIFRELGNERAEIWALNGLGVALQQMAALEEARRCYSRCAEVAAQIGYTGAEANALNNLGSMAFSYGDPGEAEQCFRQAYQIHRTHGNLRMAMTPGINVACCLKALSRYEDASALLIELLEICREQGYVNLEAQALNLLGRVRGGEGKRHKALSALRQVLEIEPPPSLEEQAEAVFGISRVLSDLDEHEEALSVLETEQARFRDRLDPDLANIMEYTLSKRLMAVGRHEEALSTLLAYIHETEDWENPGSIGAMRFRAGQCCIALGDPDRALELLRRAVSNWEIHRGKPIDLEWREGFGAWGLEIYITLADLELRYPPGIPKADRMTCAFGTLQRFKALTLLERMHGPDAIAAGGGGAASGRRPPVTLPELQEEVLLEGEVLLDIFLGPERSLLFAVTREDARVVGLPGENGVLGSKLCLYRDLIATLPGRMPTPEQAEALEAAGRSLSHLLLGEVAELVRPARRIILVPEGGMNLIPLSGLYLPGGEPLVDGWDLLRVPSAAILAEIRTRGSPGRHSDAAAGRGGPERGGSGLLAMAGKWGADGRPLTGAVWEVEALSSRYRDVDLRLAPDRGGPAIAPDELARYDVLHLAAHTTLDNQYPWRSGILLGAGDAPGDYLRASEIAGLRLKARLAVLSCCDSAGGRILSGEGVIGLTSAFLSAGVPAVVASLWPVEDQATARLMTMFYEALSDGETAASALRIAQLELKRDPLTRHPFYWAGFVVVGEGNVRLPLGRQLSGWVFGVASLICFAAGLIILVRRWRS